MDRNEDVGVVQLGEPRAGVELDRCRVGAGEKNARPGTLEQRLRLECDGERCHGLPQACRSPGTERRVPGVERDGPPPQWAREIHDRRTAHFEQQVAAIEANPIAPHAPGQLERDGELVGRRLRIAHARDQWVRTRGAARPVLHPVDVGRATIKAQREATLALRDLIGEAGGQRHAQGHRLRPGSEAHGADDPSWRWGAGGQRNHVPRVHPCDGRTRQRQAHLVAPTA